MFSRLKFDEPEQCKNIKKVLIHYIERSNANKDNVNLDVLWDVHIVPCLPKWVNQACHYTVSNAKRIYMSK